MNREISSMYTGEKKAVIFVRWLLLILKLSLCHLLLPVFRLRRILRREPSNKLHVGCGKNHFPGWVNADIDPRADMIVFLERKLPFHDGSLSLIYSEHVLEHVAFDKGVFFLTEARRVLKPGGIIRIAMPDLDDLVAGYQENWRRFDWVNWPEFSFVQTRAQMINMAFRWWGHCHLYNREELARALSLAGFVDFKFVCHGESACPELVGLETRKDSLLVVEAVKR